ncbi:MAG: hypothetical protein QJR06_09415 [Alicyclobacillaceae bacterium]|nr:hypothetical protein [Alicyclobacillaceae bacterium]
METYWTDIGFLAGLFFLSGMAGLRWDAANLADRRMDREAAWAKGMGWLNVAIGAALFAGQWAYRRWFWP